MFIVSDEYDQNFVEILEKFNKYDSDINHIKYLSDAYNLAKDLHKGILRKSNEPYIIHPLAVASLAVEYETDWVTVCTSLLHDVVEDTKCTLKEVESKFGPEVAINVDAVTKMTNMDFQHDLEDSELYVKTIRKLFKTMIYKDIRAIAVKLFDRLHNMRTLNYMEAKKRRIKAQETLEVYVPIAEAVGANKIKKELQDLSLLYLNEKDYNYISSITKGATEEHIDDVQEVKKQLNKNLHSQGINNEISLRIKNIYNVYESLKKGRTINNIHDLFALQIKIDSIPECYLALGIVHQTYPTYLQEKFKDYIYKCKTTGYRALHTTIVDQKEQMIQAQIRTKQMAWQNTRGIIGNLKDYNLEEFSNIKNNYPFFVLGEEIDKTVANDTEFYEKIRYEILGNKIFVTSATTGHCIQLPIGATILDYAFFACPDRALLADKGIVNGQPVNLNYQLKNGDFVTFTNLDYKTINKHWLKDCATTRSRRLIRENLQK